VNVCFVRNLLPAIVVAAALASRAEAENGCCAHCGCQAECRKVCRLVCEEKKVEVFCWGCKCEEFCVPCRSKPGCQHCETVCDDCETCAPGLPQSEPKRFVWLDWFPGGAKIYTRTKLMRKSESVTVPSYKWVVEDMCHECTAKHDATSVPAVAATQSTAASPGLR
jgi:hypothetical protein